MSNNLSYTVASMFMRVELSTSALTFSRRDKANTEDLTARKRAGRGAYRVSKSLFPEGYDAELKNLNQARNKARALFDKFTVHVAKSADGKRNEGEKWIRASLIADGSFLAEWRNAEYEFNNAHQAFIYAYPALIQNLEHASGAGQGLGDDFDEAEYPDIQTVREGFALTLKGPFPIADGSIYGTMPLDEATRVSLEAQYEAVNRRAVAVASQNVAADMAKYLANMAAQLEKLGVHYDTPSYGRDGKAPAIHDTLVTNVQDALTKARAFAIPDSDQGSKLMAYIDQIEQVLQPNRLDADYLKAMPGSYLANIAETAAGLAEALSGEDWD